MLIVSLDDFYEKVAKMERLSREEERECAIRMQAGDMEARQQLINSYLPMVAYRLKRHTARLRTIGLALYYIHATEKAVDSFDFLQDSETFAHRLNWYLRNAFSAYLVK